MRRCNRPACHALAAIDLGTNTQRLLIARIEPDGSLHALHADQTIARLGEGLQREGRLKPAAMQRALQTLKRWRRVLAEHGIDHPVIVATSAVRDAANRDDFLQLVRDEVGFEIEVLSGDEEARRTLTGISAGLPPSLTDVLVTDIGGGSTEFILARGSQPRRVCSTDLGTVRLTECFLASDPVIPAEIQSAERFITERLPAVKETIGDARGTTLVGTAGTITTLAAMDQQLAAYDPKKVHRSVLTLDAVQRIGVLCKSLKVAERRTLAGLEPGRADVIMAGVLIVQLTMEHFGFSTLTVSEYGLREGILVDSARRHSRSTGQLHLF